MRALHALLIEGNHQNQMIPGIASKWEVSQDGKSWTWTVGKNATFHNGEPVTAEDVFFTMERYHGKEAETGATSTGAIRWARDTEKTEIIGPDTVRVTHRQPFAPYPFQFSALQSSSAGGSVLPKNYFEQVGEKGYADQPIGAGPFKLVEFRPSEMMLFERFGDYYFNPENGYPEDRRMKFQTLDIRLVPEEATRASALQAGQADIVEVNLQSRNQVEASGGRFVWIAEASYTQVRPIGCWKPELPCHNKQVRYALDYAIDRDLIVNQLYGGTEAASPQGYGTCNPQHSRV
jgi:peptide/nickel transport system substrate-binding protein